MNKTQNTAASSNSQAYPAATCAFCTPGALHMIEELPHAFVINDKYPVTPYHRLIIPKRHVSDYFSLTQPELDAINTLLFQQKCELERSDSRITGFNIGINVGEDAGQTVFHCHVHLIPRRQGDVTHPQGGIRGVIPGKQQYYPAASTTAAESVT